VGGEEELSSRRKNQFQWEIFTQQSLHELNFIQFESLFARAQSKLTPNESIEETNSITFENKN
jgi:hypothetical protein